MSWLTSFAKAIRGEWSRVSWSTHELRSVTVVLLLVLLTTVFILVSVFVVPWRDYRQNCAKAAMKKWGEMNYGHCFGDRSEVFPPYVSRAARIGPSTPLRLATHAPSTSAE